MRHQTAEQRNAPDGGRVRALALGLGLGLAVAGCVTPAMHNADTMTAAGVLSGSIMTEAHCASWPDNAVWVVVDGRGECLRYFHHGLGETTPVAHVWFHGDRIWQDLDWQAWIPGGYEDPDIVAKLEGFAEREATTYGAPYIRLSRPGVYGSSGFHKLRRRPREARIVNAALDTLKLRYGIGRFALSGQSGGGHVVASLLTMRDDIVCAVATSGVLSVRMRAEHHGWPTDITGYSDYFDPVDHVGAIKPDRERRIFVVGDPRDVNTPFDTQAAYAAAAKAAGHDVALLTAEASGKAHHALALKGFRVVQWCLEGVPPDEIQSRLWAP